MGVELNTAGIVFLCKSNWKIVVLIIALVAAVAVVIGLAVGVREEFLWLQSVKTRSNSLFSLAAEPTLLLRQLVLMAKKMVTKQT